jgi:hypothetical protein
MLKTPAGGINGLGYFRESGYRTRSSLRHLKRIGAPPERRLSEETFPGQRPCQERRCCFRENVFNSWTCLRTKYLAKRLKRRANCHALKDSNHSRA